MKKIRLTESELTNIIKRVINEDQAESIIVKHKFADYVKQYPNDSGQFKIENGRFYIVTPEGRKVIILE